MKNIYLRLSVFCSFSFFLPAAASYGQCSCSGNISPNSVTYLQTISSTNAATSTISFPKFNPSLGTLGCIEFRDTISGASTTVIQNTGSSASDYSFLLTVANSFSAPGVSLTQTFSKNLGPETLSAGQQVTFGPDSLFLNVPDSVYVTDTAGYQGSGNVAFDYTLGGGLVALTGGLNYNSQIVTNYWGKFRLTYYYCSSGNNDPHCHGFTATKGSGCVNLNWTCDTAYKNDSSQILFSQNGYQFQPIGHCGSASGVDGDTASFKYVYNLSSNENNKIYFQIKFTDSTGNTSYSPVRWVDLSALGIAGCNLYPNPAKSLAVVEFDQMLTGTYSVSIMNSSGYCVQQKQVSLNGSNQLSLNLGGIKQGLYIVHLTDNSSHQQVNAKLVIQ
jgi:hypothetical protein